MLRSALIYLSCIHNTRLQQGLCVMMWKAVFNETIKSTLSLVEKVKFNLLTHSDEFMF